MGKKNGAAVQRVTKEKSTISFRQWLIRISLAVWYDEILVTGYVYVICVTIRMPQKVILERSYKFSTEVPHSHSSISKGQEQLILIQENKCRWRHKFRFANFRKLKSPYLKVIKSKIYGWRTMYINHVKMRKLLTSRIWRFSFSCLTRSFSLNCSIKSTLLFRWIRWLNDFKTVPSSIERIFRGTWLLVLV